MKVWKAMAGGTAPHKGVEDVGLGNKVRRIRSVLAESLRRLHRRHVLDSVCLAMERDESKHRLLFYYTSTTKTLEVHTGLLGWIRCTVGDAVTKTRQTEETFRAFSTPLGGPNKPETMNDEVYERLRQVEFMSTDAASSEMLGVKMLQRGTSLNGEAPLCPNLRVHTRDKAHATKRILKRPFDAVPFMKSVLGRFVMAKKTLLSQISYSAELLEQFKLSCQRRGLQETSLNLPKHRFACLRRGLATHVEYMLPLFDCAKYIMHTRGRREGALALAFCNESIEARVQLGMMADAAEEVMELLRFVDQDAPDLSLVCGECSIFRSKVLMMWRDRGAMRVDGYTRKVLERLKEPVCFMNFDGKLQYTCNTTLPEDDPIIERCLRRMSVWTDLALKTLETEFPAFELCQSFAALRLGSQQKHVAPQRYTEHLARLANYVDVKPETLRWELEAFKPAALTLFDAAGISSLQAWRESILRTKPGGHHVNKVPPALWSVLVKFATCTVSTHTLDSSFSVVQRRTSAQSMCQHEQSERDTVQLILDFNEGSIAKDKAVALARELWVSWYGIARTSPVMRRAAFGRKRKPGARHWAQPQHG